MSRYERKDNTSSLGEAIQAYIRVHNMQGKLDEVDAIKAWEVTGGPAVARITRSLHLGKEGKFFVTLDSGPFKEQLALRKSEIITELNAYLGRRVIRELIIR